MTENLGQCDDDVVTDAAQDDEREDQFYDTVQYAAELLWEHGAAEPTLAALYDLMDAQPGIGPLEPFTVAVHPSTADSLG
jgi:hypothetical protein